MTTLPICVVFCSIRCRLSPLILWLSFTAWPFMHLVAGACHACNGHFPDPGSGECFTVVKEPLFHLVGDSDRNTLKRSVETRGRRRPGLWRGPVGGLRPGGAGSASRCSLLGFPGGRAPGARPGTGRPGASTRPRPWRCGRSPPGTGCWPPPCG